MSSISAAAAVMGGLGLAFGIALAVAYRFLRVQENPKLDLVDEMLPGTNCGACGSPGCRAFAETLVEGNNAPSSCTVASADLRESIADLLGVDAGEEVKRVARLRCAGGRSQAKQIAEYEGFDSCGAAALSGGGGKACAWGCLGLGDCEDVCDCDAIQMNADGLPVVDVELCTACNDCVEVCPKHLFEILPITHSLLVQCNAPLEGDEARAVCEVTCDACGRCALDAAPGLVRMENGLPVVDYGRGGPASPDATHRCPTGAIQWVSGNQFAEQAPVQIRVKRHA